jgi:predicted AlkP superfamily pyrophosphatase or phosphodiesterase
VDQVLTWLDLPAAQRPALTTLYFDIVDTMGHHHGPDGAETLEAMASVDASIGRLVDGLKARGLYENTVLVVVSDHGMAATSPDRVTVLDDIVDPEAVQIIYSGAVTFLNPVAGREAEVEQALLGSRPHLDCWRKSEIPARLILGSNPRVSAIVCASEPGWLLATRDRMPNKPGGAHGYGASGGMLWDKRAAKRVEPKAAFVSLAGLDAALRKPWCDWLKRERVRRLGARQEPTGEAHNRHLHRRHRRVPPCPGGHPASAWFRRGFRSQTSQCRLCRCICGCAGCLRHTPGCPCAGTGPQFRPAWQKS